MRLFSFAIVLNALGCGPGDAPPEESLVAGQARVGPDAPLAAPILFVSRPPQSDGSAAWPSDRDGPLEVPGLGARARVRPAPPGKLLVLQPDGEVRALVDGSQPTEASLNLVDVNAPSVSYDGRWVVFAGLREGEADDVDHGLQSGTAVAGAWRLFVIGADGEGLRQLTFDEPQRTEAAYVQQFGEAAGRALLPFDDFDPVFLPTGNVAFSSTRWPSFAHYGDQRTSQLYVVPFDGGEPKRITSERNGADRAVVDPISGDLIYARWWQTGRPPTDQDGTQSGEDGLARHNGLKQPDAPDDQPSYDGPVRRSWHAARINPDGYGLGLFAGFERSDLHSQYYGGTFADDGTLYGNWFPIGNMTDQTGFGGVRAIERGAHKPVAIVGVNVPRTDFVPVPDASLAKPTGVVMQRFAMDPAVLPKPGSPSVRDGDLLVSMTHKPGDLSQDYGLYVVDRTGNSEPRLLFDLPGTAELRAVVLAPRTPARIRNDIATGFYRELPPPAVPMDPSPEEAEAVASNGLFHFNPLNVYANAPVDVDIVSAMPIGSVQTLRAFADYQRGHPGTPEGRDWPILLAEVPVSPSGVVSVHAPANVPLFEDVRDAEGRVGQTGGHYGAQRKDVGAAFVAGMNYAPIGFHSRCVGCHAGHSQMEVPDDDEEALWTNLAPGAKVTLSSVSDESRRTLMEAALVDRKVVKADPTTAWRSADGQRAESATLTFPVPVWVRAVHVHDPATGPGAELKSEGVTVTLYSDRDGTREVSQRTADGAGEVSFVGSTQVAGVRSVRVEIAGATGRSDQDSTVSVAEIEVVARGDRPAEGVIPEAPIRVVSKPDDYPVGDASGGPALAVYDGMVAPGDGGRSSLPECQPGETAVTFEAPMPLKGPGVSARSVEHGDDGGLRLAAGPGPRPEYTLVIEGDCENCAWKSVALEWELGSRNAILTRTRAGKTATPDRSWSTPSPRQRGTLVPVHAWGRYLEVDFTMTRADIKESPVLYSVRACYTQ